MAKSKVSADPNVVEIKAPNFVVATVHIKGTAPFVQEAFSQKTRDELMAHMSTASGDKKNKKQRPVRDYAAEFEQAQHKSVAGWNGIPCNAFLCAMVDACRVAGIVMTTAKMSLKVLADGVDAVDGTPLVRLHSPQPPEMSSMPVRNANGSIDIRVRPMWREWRADVSIQFDSDMINAQSVVNLLERAGQQVGVGAGRPFSKKSVGMGWGTFTVVQESIKGAAA